MPYEIAQHLADWALRGSGNDGVILDPTRGDSAFLGAAADLLAAQQRTGRLIGTDIDQPSLDHTAALLGDAHGCVVDLLLGDIFEEPTPAQLTAQLPYVDAVIGNPPYVRYHEHINELVARGHWSDATTVVDEVLLQRIAGVLTRELEISRTALIALRRRRHRRSANGE